MLVLKKYTNYLPTYTSTKGEQVLKCYVEKQATASQTAEQGLVL
jgi:hypothetical protein